MVGASWSCTASGVSRPPRQNDHFEAILERNYLRPLNTVRKMARFNKKNRKVFFRSISPYFLTKTISWAGLHDTNVAEPCYARRLSYLTS